MKQIILLICIFCLALCSYSQKYDYIWQMGYNGTIPDPDFGGFQIDFNYEPPLFTEFNRDMNINKTNASMSDINGNLLFYTNGIFIADASHEIMLNGDTINNCGISQDYSGFGLRLNQGVLILSKPESKDSLFYVLHTPLDHDPGGLNFHVPKILYTTININKNNDLGSVIEKDITVIKDTLETGKITATKHANGRDWWVLISESDEAEHAYYKLLVTPNGIEEMGKEDSGITASYISPSIGQAVFSPNGNYYARHEIRFEPQSVINIYDFDRCTGDMDLIAHFSMNDTTFLAGGIAFSPDSKYLYVITRDFVYQFDIQANDVEASKTLVAEYDGFVGAFFPSWFTSAQLAPDGKIYFASAVSDTVMHVINTPNQFGLGSNVKQHSINLPNLNDKSIPNFPNYRLGPLDGSPCDTLGLDNHPLAGFTYFPEELTVTFSDNSYYRPEEWAWDFGDGQSSTERNPVHSYDMAGEYYVCLTVRNEIDEDTYCRWVQVDTMMVVGTGEVLDAGAAFSLFPNPAKDEVTLILTPLKNESRLMIFDSFGKQVYDFVIPPGVSFFKIDINSLPSGVYFISLKNAEKDFPVQKLIITK